MLANITLNETELKAAVEHYLTEVKHLTIESDVIFKATELRDYTDRYPMGHQIQANVEVRV